LVTDQGEEFAILEFGFEISRKVRTMSKRTTRTDFESLEISADPKSAIQNQKSGPVEQQVLALPSTDPSTGPVECLGMSFPNDDERRKYFLKKLPEKLKDPDFRKIKGFPIGEDEDILALSDPPYYTACPNPWLTDFVMFYGTAYNPKKHYHREPFAADVNEGKNHPIYNAHSYHTKVPHRAILRYILHYTEPGDLVFDGFAGTGMTGVAARLCGNRSEVQALGYRVHEDGAVLNEQGQNFSKVGARHIIINDLSTIATFVANGYMMPVDAPTFQREVRRVLAAIETEPGWMFETFHLFSATYSSALNAALKLFTGMPPQIHSYLSTNFKELRNLPSDHLLLRSKARDRWYVPDPKKNSDVEKLREKRLLEEFWSYLPPGYEPASRSKTSGTAYLPGMEPSKSKLPKGKRLAIARTEAVRVGFNFCFSQNDYETIIAVAQHIPDDVIHKDEQLQMISDLRRNPKACSNSEFRASAFNVDLNQVCFISCHGFCSAGVIHYKKEHEDKREQSGLHQAIAMYPMPCIHFHGTSVPKRNYFA
jgi:hypothetical protein